VAVLKLFILSFVVSFCVGYLIVRWEHLHAHFTGDVAVPGSHKVHAASVSRIGGVAIVSGWLASVAASSYAGKLPTVVAFSWAVCLLPAFVAGLTEDFTKRVAPSTRLLSSFVAGGLAYTFLGAGIERVDVYGVDTLLMIPAVSFLFTIFAIGGVAQAINIIDGLNGLATGACMIALVGLGYVAFNVGDDQIVLLCGIGAAALLGFRVWNYPSGRVFCGDGGAYFLGVYVAILAALLVHRHRDVSAWFPLLLLLYPIWETVFSAYRRRVLRGLPASTADKLHLHTLFYKRVRRPWGGVKGALPARRNSDASVLVMILAGGSAVPAVLWWSEGPYLLAAVLLYIAIYLVIYKRLVGFGSRVKKRSVIAGGPLQGRGRAVAMRRGVARRTLSRGGKTR
jgi:UDP-N-acetylmuramyl pentapeptide phosphotransferase/UDP-N-acetylglucosamine-1-phosphate transferase